jgi:hypothetical protein
MKRILMLLVVLALSAVVAGPLMAQANPFVGTWKLNVAKSKAGSGPALPQSLTRTVAADGAGATYTFTGVSSDGKPVSYSFSTNYDGKDSAITGNGAPGGADTISIKRLAPSKSSAVLKKGGTEVGTSVAEVSKDGKVTTLNMKGKGADGKEFSGVTVYDKQ